MVTIADLIAYRRRNDRLVERVVTTRLPTAFGEFEAVGYRSLVDEKHHVALVKGEVAGRPDVLVRVHSECLTGDVFHSLRCDCGEQLEVGARDDRARGGGRAALPLPGGPRDRAAEQAARLPPAGGRPRHRRSQRAPGPACRPARLRDRRADPRRTSASPRSASSPTTPRRSAGSRATGSRSPRRSRSSRPPTSTTPTYLRTKARADGPHPAPPGPQPRRGAAALRARAATASAATDER